ncbi:hypothetical protein [Pectobacterium sp. A5351]|uniref:hypothetical protein n=1 Tax=Pectobacterium sp. A5351 TaxID=2914983 RepID=UPI00232AA73E|nr:hypothetical protein [Pectobacterium sp. A5351]WCG83923.1 hypothetical protein O1Q74_04335 [Pectobacterium sp. A5351]
MAVNQARIFEQLEQITHELNRDEFIYGFMAAFDFPKSTIMQMSVIWRSGILRTFSRRKWRVNRLCQGINK